MSDLKLPLALVIAMVAQIVAGVWWVSKQAHRIEHLETQVAEFKKKSESKNNANQDHTLPYFDPQDLSFLDEIKV